LIAQKGYKVRLFERERFPRFHIGESLIPDTYWVFQRLNMLEKLKRSHFVPKHSAQFVNQHGRLSAPFYFSEHNPHECSATWQVRRSEFDTMMLENAAEQGVDVHQGVRVREVLFDGDRATGVRVQHGEDAFEDVSARVVVDASGQSAFIANRFKILERDPQLKKGTVWTYWKGAFRETGRDEGATTVIQTRDRKGWWWYIPLHDDIVSVGVVRAFDELFAGNREHEDIFCDELEQCGDVKRRLSTGTRCDRYYATKDYSYRATRCAGDGWVLVGDAHGFLDPLYSSGVLLALKTGELAADAITDGLARGDVSAAQLGAWGPEFNRGMDYMRRLVCAYYDGFSFGKFLRRYPQFRGTLTDLLIGNLWKPGVDEVFGPMEEMWAEVTASED
jgi:flavin-dependent dehydrogenase